MRIFIITMDDPVQTNAFIKKIIDERKDDIVGLAISKGDRMTISKGKSKLSYLISLFLIMGLSSFLKNGFVTLIHKLKKKLSGIGLGNDPTMLGYATKLGIPVFEIKTPNNKIFRENLQRLKPDVIINQSQSIIRKELLKIPAIGVLNRHNALLPKNRGRLTPFWVLFNKELETGVSIHFVEEGLDSGDIVVQEKYAVTSNDDFNSLVKKNYEIAPLAMLKALSFLEKGDCSFLPNDDINATYNSTPTLKDAWSYRKMRLFKRVY